MRTPTSTVERPTPCFRQGGGGSTALHLAVEGESSAAVLRTLVEAQPFALLARDSEGRTPLDALCKMHGSALERILEMAEDLKDRERMRGGRKEIAGWGVSGARRPALKSWASEGVAAAVPPELARVIEVIAAMDPRWSPRLRGTLLDFWSKSSLMVVAMSRIVGTPIPVEEGRDDDNGEYGSAPGDEVLRAAASLPPRSGLCPLVLLRLVAVAEDEEDRDRRAESTMGGRPSSPVGDELLLMPSPSPGSSVSDSQYSEIEVEEEVKRRGRDGPRGLHQDYDIPRRSAGGRTRNPGRGNRGHRLRTDKDEDDASREDISVVQVRTAEDCYRCF